MKVKELEKTANLAWSPKSQYPILLAAGTAAQQVDASFSTSAELELFSINLGDPSQDLELRCSVPSDSRFHKLVWGGCGYSDLDELGLIVGGCDSGRIAVYNTAKLLRNENGVIKALDGHCGAVKSLDFNHFQKNLLASGASKSEIFIWDMNKLTTPMTPGKAVEPLDDILSLAWNKQVPHILTSAFNTRCLVWDLKKNEAIIKLTDPTAKSRWKVVTWDPQVATQLCLASEEDHYPVVQLWDLRYATTPVKVFEGHQKGVLSVDWCDEDPDLLISCGKDNKLLVWNPNTSSQTGEIICNMTLSTQWNFEVNWCPRNPFLVSTASFDGRASIHSLSGGKPAPPTTNKIADSFPGMNAFPAPLQHINQQQPVIELLKPPRWIKKPFGVSFGFGGKLMTFGPTERTVYVSQVVTEPDLMFHYKNLEDVLEHGNVFNHCYNKAEQVNDPIVSEVWKFIACQMYGNSFKEQAIMFLGCSVPQLNEKLKALNIDASSCKTEQIISEPPSHISRIGPSDGADIFDNLLVQQQNSSASSVTDGGHDFEILKNPLKFPQNNDIEGALCEALILGDMETAVDLLIRQSRWMDALVLSLSKGSHLVNKTKDQYFKKSDNCLTSLIGAIINEDWCNIVETCELSNWKQVLVTLLTYARDEELRTLSALLGQRLLVEGDEILKKNALICFVCAADVNMLIEHWNLKPTTSVEIHELTELGLIMKEAAKSRGICGSVSGALASVIVKYAELLASQGYLSAAYTYLGDSDDERVQELKNRLMYALELKIAYHSHSQSFLPKNNMYFDSSHKPNQTHPNLFSTNPVQGILPLVTSNDSLKSNPKPPPVSHPSISTNEKSSNLHLLPPVSNAMGSNQLSYGGSRMNSSIQNFVSNACPTSYPSATNLFPGPPSTSTASATIPFSNVGNPATSFSNPSGTPTATASLSSSNRSRSGSVLSDMAPAISSGLMTSAPPVTPLPAATPPAVATAPPPPPSTSQIPYHSSRQTPEPVAVPFRSKYVVDPSVQGRGPSYSGGFTAGGYSNMSAIVNQPQPTSLSQPFTALVNDSSSYSMANQPSVSSVFQSVQQQNIASYIPNATGPATGVPIVQTPKTGSLPSSTSGWNDPPSFLYDKPFKSQQPMNSLSINSGVSTLLPTNIQSATQAQVLTDHTIHYGGAHNSFQSSVPQSGSRVTVAEEAIQKPKPPLPEEHVHLQTVFDELRNQCLQKTSNQMMKRKLVEVSRKLDMLYDSIRDHKLSPPTLNGLHEIVNAIQRHDYMSCFDTHTQLVNGTDFATIASFMPGVKVLLQHAIQLQVYL